MSATRRQFLSASATALLFSQFDPTFAKPNASSEDDPNDPNRIVDPDGEIGKPYAGWREGDFDIHFIQTGWGENIFQIFPDGTTALVDAGEFDNDAERGPKACPLLPDASRAPSEWVARYIDRLRPDLKTIDYVVATHFHCDHIGSPFYGRAATDGREPDYMISGITGVGEHYRFGKAFDRGYPNYDKPTPKMESARVRDNLRKFWEYKEREDGLVREEFQVGALDQIKPVVAPDKYDFHVRNIAANGVVWDGKTDETIDFFNRWPNLKAEIQEHENELSLATLTSYGPFRFYSGGDAAGFLRDSEGVDLDFEGAIGRAVGPVDVCKANHHATEDSMRQTFVDAVQARVYVVCVWCGWHLWNCNAATMGLDPRTGEARETLICPTAIHPEGQLKLADQPWRKRLVERGGHVVVKAYDGGARYKVYYLKAEDESMRVELVFGPFESKGAV